MVIPLSCVIGFPVTHSKSPIIHRYWLKKYQISGDYILVQKNRDDFPLFLKKMYEDGFIGANITVPYKELVLNYVDVISDKARKIGSANTLLLHQNGKIEADSTDGFGFITSLKQHYPDYDFKNPVFILGAGGAARAVIYALIEQGACDIRLMNRDDEKTQRIIHDFGQVIKAVKWCLQPDFKECGLIINCTSIGIQSGKFPDFSTVKNDSIAMDLIYGKTLFLSEIGDYTPHLLDGLGMLLHQARPGFHRWFGVYPDIDDNLLKLLQ